MAQLPLRLNDIERHLCCLKPFQLAYLVRHCMIY